MTTPFTVLPETNFRVLEHLQTYVYLTAPQLVRLGVVTRHDSMNRVLQRFADFRKCVDFFEFGTLPRKGRLARVYYLTKHGAEWLAEAWRVDPETIRYPRAATVFFHDYFHRNATLDFEIALRQYLERNDGAVEFYHRYFDSSGANRNPDPAGRLQRPTKVPLGDRFFHPDAVFAVSAPGGTRFLYALEVYNGIDTRRVYGQLQKHMLALQEGRLSDLYRYEKAHRVLCVFENDNALQAAAQRLRADPVFTGQLYRHFAFSTLADLQADSLTGWHFWSPGRTSIFDVQS